ncbi:MAG: hypothetical protein IKQ37_06990 [Bacteroidaceae bacterium]|nr:hypothetical protein [Bacteroidaceae bacterium]
MYQRFQYDDSGFQTDVPDGGQHDPEKGTIHILIAVLILLLILAFLSGCKSVQYVPVIEHRTDTVLITKHQHDSIFVSDSTHVKEKQRGDTIWLEVERWHTKYIEKQIHDTTYIATHDTVPEPYPVPEYIEKQLSWWQQTRLRLANIVLIAALIAAAWWVFKKRTWWLALLKKLF